METDLEVDKAIIELNTISVVSLTRAVLTHMIKQGSGQIAVISSVAGKLGETGTAVKWHTFNITHFVIDYRSPRICFL